jgi:hypothetical protein
MPRLIQKSVECCAWLIDACWTAAIERPKSRKMSRKPVKAITMPTTPKSSAVSNRARTTIEPIRKTKFAPWPAVETKAPRMVLPFRSWGGVFLPEASEACDSLPSADADGSVSPMAMACPAAVVLGSNPGGRAVMDKRDDFANSRDNPNLQLSSRFVGSTPLFQDPMSDAGPCWQAP